MSRPKIDAMPTESLALARVLRDARHASGLDQHQLASLAGVSISTIRKLESDSSPEPGFFIIGRIVGSLRSHLERPDALDRDVTELWLRYR